MTQSQCVAWNGYRKLTDPNGFARSVNVNVRAKIPEIVDDAIEKTRQGLRHFLVISACDSPLCGLRATARLSPRPAMLKYCGYIATPISFSEISA